MIGIEQVDRVDLHGIPGSEAEAMTFCMRISAELWQGTVDGEIACVWGLIPPTLMSNQAYLWLYTNELVLEHQFLFVRYSQRMVEHMLDQYDTIVGHVRVGSDRSIRWLRWLGAVLGEPTGTKIPFTIRNKNG